MKFRILSVLVQTLTKFSLALKPYAVIIHAFDFSKLRTRRRDFVKEQKDLRDSPTGDTRTLPAGIDYIVKPECLP